MRALLREAKKMTKQQRKTEMTKQQRKTEMTKQQLLEQLVEIETEKEQLEERVDGN